MMTPQQITIVQTTWQDVVPIADAAAKLFYSRLFVLDPSLESLFTGKSADQRRRLMMMIGVAVTGLTRVDTIAPVLRNLGARHVDYGVRDEHYATVGAALLWTLEQGLGDKFTPEARDAWTAAYMLIASTMQEGAAQRTASTMRTVMLPPRARRAA
jgi:hemoglobin-like flavoprotein